VFYCSPGHWNAVHAAHISSRDGEPSQCVANRDIRAHEVFRTTDAGKQLAVRPWVPSRIAKKWVPLASEGGVSQWEEAFGDELRKEFKLTDEAPVERYLWSMSEPMSMSMTILYALQEFNDTDAWTGSETLVIHVFFAIFLFFFLC
jgi:splicing suppressor protein 51